MKIRNGFVSNSSSSSFIINRADITEYQLWALRHYKQLAKAFDIYGANIDNGSWLDDWFLFEREYTLTFSTEDSSCQLWILFDKMNIKYHKEAQ